jgi:hypothetical protein
MLDEHPAHRLGELRHPAAPVLAPVLGEGRFQDRAVDHRRDQRLAAAEVVVERRIADAERVRHRLHGQALDAQAPGRGHDPLPVDGGRAAPAAPLPRAGFFGAGTRHAPTLAFL